MDTLFNSITLITRGDKMAETNNFKSVEISDVTEIKYMTEVEISSSVSHKNQSTIVECLNDIYPTYVNTGIANYWHGSVTANFADNQTNPCPDKEYGDYDFTNSKFRFDFVEWMHNGYPKTLKLANDFIMLVGIGNEIQLQSDTTIDNESCKISFEWTQLAPRYSEE